MIATWAVSRMERVLYDNRAVLWIFGIFILNQLKFLAMCINLKLPIFHDTSPLERFNPFKVEGI